jgi:hypothetical protein
MLKNFFHATKKRGVIDNTAYVYIIAGQSNTGRAVASSLPSNLQSPITNAFIFNRSTNLLETLQAGVNTLLADNTAGQFGPEVKLASLLQPYLGRKIYFLKYGVGASKLAADTGNDWNVSSTNELYNNLKTYITTLKTALLSSGKTPVIKAIIWMQGEEDATNATHAAAYEANLTALIGDIRTFLVLPNLPFIIGRINGASDASEVYRADVRAAQAAVDSAVANTYLIDTDSYPLQDTVHYNYNGQQTFGQDIFNIAKNF